MRENILNTSFRRIITSLCCITGIMFVTTPSVAEDAFDPEAFVKDVVLTGEIYNGGAKLSCRYPSDWVDTDAGQYILDYDNWEYAPRTDSDKIRVLGNTQDWAFEYNGVVLYGTSRIIPDSEALYELEGACWNGDGCPDDIDSYDVDVDDSKDGGCFCKITGISGPSSADEYIISDTSWVYLDRNYGNVCPETCFFDFYDNDPEQMLNNATFTKVSITVATTKYVESKFTPISTELNTTIGKIKNVVENTIKQSDKISALHTGKQNRPDDYNASEKCPAGRNCLLITESDGSLHWYPICDADGSIEPLFDLADFAGNGNTYYCHGNDTTYREITNKSTATAYTSQPGTNAGVRQLQETEWAVKWNGKGVVYGTSVCNSNIGTSGVASQTEQTESKGQYCWCRMTSVADTNGTEYPSVGSWVFIAYDNAGDCACDCAYGCADYVQGHSDFRSAVLGGGN